MNKAITLTGILMLTLALATGCANRASSEMGAPKTAAGHAPDATVMIDDTFVAYIGGTTLGSGTMTYKSHVYHLKLSGLDIDNPFKLNIKASGGAYLLNDPWDFVGTYVTAAKGKNALWLKNEKGVYLHLDSNMGDLARAIGGNAIEIKMYK